MMLNPIGRLNDALVTQGIPIVSVSGGRGTARIDYADSATQAQRTQGDAILAGFDWSEAADVAYQLQRQRAEAEGLIDSPAQGHERLVRALALMILDEFNAHTTVEAAMFAAVAAATSLADLKVRFAAVQQHPQRTQAQLINAIKAKLNSE
jgi:hypothetical protein